MVNGGSLDEGSRIHFPLEFENGSKKFAKTLMEIPFQNQTVIGQVTASTFSQRRGHSSGLGLISLSALRAYLTSDMLPNDAFTIAIEKEINGKYYIAKFRVVHN